jgi:zinc transport system permease protein
MRSSRRPCVRRSILILGIVVFASFGAGRARAQMPGDAAAGSAAETVSGDDDLGDIEQALGEDQAQVAAKKQAAEAADKAAEDASTPVKIDVDTGDEAPTWSELVDNWDLFRDPIYAAGIAGLVLGFLSVFIVLRRMVFVSAAVTQAAGFGVALSFYASAVAGFTLDPVWGATAMSLITAALVAPDPKRFGLSREMVLGLAFAFFAAGAVLAGARIPQEAHEVEAILFGTAVAVSKDDMHRLALVGGFVLAIQIWWFRGITFASFDSLAARVQGLPVRLLDLVLLISIGVSVGQAARALGALPAFALSVLPGTAAVQLARGPLIVTFAVAALIGAACGVFGYLAAFFLRFPVGATQTVLASLVVMAATLIHVAGNAIARMRLRA